jgi:hypothetical protein
MTGEAHTEALRHGLDDQFESVVGERPDLATGLVDEVVMVPVRVGDLVTSDPIASVEAVQEAQFEEFVEGAIHGSRRPCSALAKPVDDLLRAEQALAVACEEFYDRPAGRTRSAAPDGELPIGTR